MAPRRIAKWKALCCLIFSMDHNSSSSIMLFLGNENYKSRTSPENRIWISSVRNRHKIRSSSNNCSWKLQKLKMAENSSLLNADLTIQIYYLVKQKWIMFSKICPIDFCRRKVAKYTHYSKHADFLYLCANICSFGEKIAQILVSLAVGGLACVLAVHTLNAA